MDNMNTNNKNNKKQDKKPNFFGDFNTGDPNSNNQMKFMRNIFIWLLLFGVIITFYMVMNTNHKPEWPVSYTTYKELLEDERVNKAEVVKTTNGDYEFHGELKEAMQLRIEGRMREVKHFVTKLGVVDSETEKYWESKSIEWTYESGENSLWIMLMSILPWILLFGIFIFFMRRMQMGGSRGGLFSFGKSKAKLLNENHPKVTFKDVAGTDEAKEELEEIIEFLKEPTRFQKLGGKIPRGVLLLGPPGTGKTLLARAVAGEAEVPFFSISGADFVEMFVGVGASRVRDLFEQAKKNAPCIVFIDEMDAVGRQRGAGVGGGHDEREQTLNQLLVEMDGFEQNNGVIIIAATNRPDVLDPALLRPGRFDRQVVVDRPDVKGREGILKVHTREIPLGDDVDLKILARGTPGFSGADIANIVNEAALLAARRDSDKVTMYDFENAKDKVMMGIERKSMVISDKEKELTAYHEMGHALVGKMLANSDPVHKVTIIPRGRALGVTSYLPVEDTHSWAQDYIESKIVTLLAGRAAEKIVFDKYTSGAANDLDRATKLAKKMVCDWGMSDALGPVHYNNQHEEVFLGREITQSRDHSEKTAQEIDSEVRRILTKSNDKATEILLENIDLLHRTSKILLEREVLEGEELDIIIRGEELPPLNLKKLNALRSMKINGNSKKKENVEDDSSKKI
jgi:cell division protease FtsH